MHQKQPVPSLTVSKWLKHQVLLSEEEMHVLFGALPHFSIYNVSEVVTEDKIAREVFLDVYGKYVAALQRGEEPQDKEYRRVFSSVFSVSPEVIGRQEMKEGRFLARPTRPVVQLQLHRFLASEVDGKYHSMVLGQESISWGIQFAYPQIFQDPESKAFLKVTQSPEFPNTALFSQMAKWFRSFTVPVTFSWKGKITPTAMRLGKECLSWINHHRMLKEKGIAVHVY